MDIEVGEHWRHKKRGSIYEIVGTDAAMQISCKRSPYYWDHSMGDPRQNHTGFFGVDQDTLDSTLPLTIAQMRARGQMR